MPKLTIRLARGRDKRDVLTCLREDGSATWGELHPALPIHDLSHYAVEHTLGLDDAFFGLIAQGWNIPDFGKPYPRGAIPDQAQWAESVVSVFWRVFIQRDNVTHDELREQIAASLAGYSGSFHREITDAQIDSIRATQGELAAAWARTPVGESIALPFSRPSA